MLKAELRKRVKELKRQYSEAQLRDMSLQPISLLLAHRRMKAAQTVLMYYSLPDEVYTHEAIDRLVADGKRVLLPVVTGENTMQLHTYESAADLQKGAYGIMEPTGELFSDLQKIDIAVVPGMAFDCHGNRMGRGKGYYDRFLALAPQTYKIGIGFSFQLFDDIPSTPLDIKMDEIIT